MEQMNSRSSGHSVFISYANEDRGWARRFAESFRAAGVEVWMDEWSLAPGDALTSRISDELSSGDTFVLILSQNWVNSRWSQHEAALVETREFDERGIMLVPVRIDDCTAPKYLQSWPTFDVQEDSNERIQSLVSRVAASEDLNLLDMQPAAFERLVRDLLNTQGFQFPPQQPGGDRGIDAYVTTQAKDPSGNSRQETWLVQAKHYRSRIPLVALDELVMATASRPAVTGALLVTSGQLTSVARQHLQESMSRTKSEVRVIEGGDIRRLLLQNPDLLFTYAKRGHQ